MKINPDNVATPIAASLGDLVTLAILAYTSSTIYSLNDVNEMEIGKLVGLKGVDDATELLAEIHLSFYTCVIILLIYYLAITPCCFMLAKENGQTKLLLFSGWTPGNISKFCNW